MTAHTASELAAAAAAMQQAFAQHISRAGSSQGQLRPADALRTWSSLAASCTSGEPGATSAFQQAQLSLLLHPFFLSAQDGSSALATAQVT